MRYLSIKTITKYMVLSYLSPAAWDVCLATGVLWNDLMRACVEANMSGHGAPADCTQCVCQMAEWRNGSWTCIFAKILLEQEPLGYFDPVK